MSETVQGVYRNGVIEPAEPLKIADGTPVFFTLQQQRSREELLALLTKLKDRGVIENIPVGAGEPFPDIEPIKIKGGPISDTIVEGRGPR